MDDDTRMALMAIRRWAAGDTIEQGLRFWRGVIVGLLLSVALIVAMAAIKRPWERRAREDAARDVARLSGYSSCCMDVMAIFSNGGGVDEVIEFSRAKAETEFSSLVSPTNFYAR